MQADAGPEGGVQAPTRRRGAKQARTAGAAAAASVKAESDQDDNDGDNDDDDVDEGSDQRDDDGDEDGGDQHGEDTVVNSLLMLQVGPQARAGSKGQGLCVPLSGLVLCSRPG